VSALFDASAGDQLESRTVTITRADLVAYAGASGDLNPIHWNERVALEVGLPGVIAHGMFTMSLAARYVADLAGDPTAVVGFTSRFTRPVVVPDDDAGASVELGAKVTDIADDGTRTVSVTASFDGRGVLGKAVATVRPR
jgi:acyl dehydratase